MLLSISSPHMLASIALLFAKQLAASASTTMPLRTLNSASSNPTSFPVSNGTCDNRSFVPLLHILPSVCSRRERTDSIGNSSQFSADITKTTVASGDHTNNLTRIRRNTTIDVESAKTSSGISGTNPESLDSDDALDESAFLSFEEWKKQMLEKTDAEPDSNIARDGEKLRKPEVLQERLDNIMEDGEIDIDISQFLGHAGDESDQEPSPKQTTEDPGTAPSHTAKSKLRNKDASTSKERFNFALDKNGGQIMKTNPEAKSASAILSENRDVYMLNTCQASGKYLIVELSEPVLVEAVAIANFEFFSSTFRQFRVSVSDRYPTKLDQWKDLGTFEAKNSRDIQPFLVEDPRIWARYFRLELMTHWGNEYYCPVSLLRVHGRNMIEDINQLSITGDEDEDSDDMIQTYPAHGIGSVVGHEVDQIMQVEIVNVQVELDKKESDTSRQSAGESSLSQNSNNSTTIQITSTQQMYTPWHKSQSLLAILVAAELEMICSKLHTRLSGMNSDAISTSNPPLSSVDTLPNRTQLSAVVTETPPVHSKLSVPKHNIDQNLTASAVAQGGADTITSVTDRVSSMPGPSVIQSSTAMPISKASTTSVLQASHPATQESFFKMVNKRLQLLETNATLSLKYIEEQSKILREAFSKVERRQLRKTTDFLETLNATILAELRNFGRQYDQIWQSTVIELESQRDQSHRELAVVSLRLNMLADELVFQKRMSIVQSILLLLCLGLVVFSRLLAGGQIDVPMVQSMLSKTRSTSGRLLESASSSMQIDRTDLFQDNQDLPYGKNQRRGSDLSTGLKKSHSKDNSPHTPLSDCSGQDRDVQNYSRSRRYSRGEHIISNTIGNEITSTGHDQSIFIDPLESGENYRSEALEDHSPISSTKLRNKNSRIRRTWHQSADTVFHSSSPIYGGNLSTENVGCIQDFDTYATSDTVERPKNPHQLPSPPPESSSEFIASQKPLPAIPQE